MNFISLTPSAFLQSTQLRTNCIYKAHFITSYRTKKYKAHHFRVLVLYSLKKAPWCRYIYFVGALLVDILILSRSVLFKNFSLLLFTFIVTLISLLLLYKYLFKLVSGTMLLLVFEHAVHTFFATNLSKNKTKKY